MSEQLEGLRRILDDVVAPAVDGLYPADVLRGVLASLDAIAAGWAEVPSFLVWDAYESLELLRAAANDDDTLARVRALDAAAPSDALDLHAVEEHHARVRAALAAAAPSIAIGPLADRLAAHLRARVDHYPIRVVHRLPGQN